MCCRKIPLFSCCMTEIKTTQTLQTLSTNFCWTTQICRPISSPSYSLTNSHRGRQATTITTTTTAIAPWTASLTSFRFKCRSLTRARFLLRPCTWHIMWPTHVASIQIAREPPIAIRQKNKNLFSCVFLCIVYILKLYITGVRMSKIKGIFYVVIHRNI